MRSKGRRWVSSSVISHDCRAKHRVTGDISSRCSGVKDCKSERVISNSLRARDSTSGGGGVVISHSR